MLSDYNPKLEDRSLKDLRDGIELADKTLADTKVHGTIAWAMAFELRADFLSEIYRRNEKP